MLRQCAYVKLLALLAVLTAGSTPAWAVLRVTNGGFDSQGANVHLNSTLTPDGWFSGSLAPNTQSDTLINSQNGTLGRWVGNAHLFGNSTPFANDGTSETGYIYQSLGTYAGEGSISIRGYVFNRTNPANLVGNFDVAVYATGAGAFEPGNGIDINAAAFPVGAAAPTVYTQGTEFQITTGVNPQRAQWTYTATLTGAANPGDTIWLRIGDGGNPGNVAADEPIIDDVTVLQGANGFDLGDSDGDGDADLADFANIRNNFRLAGIPIATAKQQGDLDGSGDVDFFDYLQWRQRFINAGGVAADIPALVGVPEPGSVALAAIALAPAVGVIRRRRVN